MQQAQPAKVLQIHISESDRHQDQPLHEAIVAKCREKRIAGVTVFRGLEGYGGMAEMHRPHLLRHDQPIVIVVVDSAERVAELLPALEEMMDTGTIAVADAMAIRVNRGQPD
jgi:uncharacterized protein